MAEGAVDPIVLMNATNAAANGKVDAGTVVTVAKNAGSVDEATTNIAAIAHAGNTVKLYDAMKAASPSQQASGWQGLSPVEQESLKSVGYQPPNLDALSHAGAGGQHGGIWSDVAGGLSDALHTVEHVGSDVPHALSDAGNAVQSGQRAVQHIIRTGYVEGEEANPWEKNYGQGGLLGQMGQSISGHPPPGAFSQAWHALTDPSSWAQAWHETTNGNTSIDPIIKTKLDNQYGSKQVSLALRVADQGANAVVQGAPAGQRPALINQVQDPKFGQLVTQVSNARLSFGRMIVGSQFLNQHPLAGKWISGSLDASTDVLLDPANVLGKVTEAAKVLRYGIDASNASDVVRSSAGVQRLANRISPLLEQGRYGELSNVDSRLGNIAAELKDMSIDSGEKFKDYLASKAGQAAMFSGRAARISQGVPLVPHLTYLGWMKSGIKDALSAGIDRLADGKVDPDLSQIPLDDTDVGGAGEALPGHPLRVQNAVDLLSKGKLAGGYGKIPGVSDVARLVRRTSTLIPSKPYISIADTTRDADGIAQDSGPDVTNFKRYVQGFLPSKLVDQLSNVFVNSDEGERRQLVTAAIKQNLHAAGLYKTADGNATADGAFAELDDLNRKQAYSVNGLDTLLEDNGMPARHALLEGQKAQGVSIPMPSAVRRLVRQNGILTAFGVNPMNGVDHVMSLWRTMILDRPGFVARMGLDETLSRLLRTNPKAVLGSFLTTGAERTRTDENIAGQVQQEIEDGTTVPEDAVTRNATLKGLANKPLLPYHPTLRALQILSDHAPEGLKPYIDTPTKWYGAVTGGMVNRWARQAERGGLKSLGLEKYVAAGENFAKYQNTDDMEDVLAHGRGAEGFGWSPEAQIRQMKVGGKAAIMAISRRAPYSEGKVGEFGYPFRWQVGLDQIANSKLGRAALETVNESRQTSVDAVKGVLKDPSFAAEKKGFVWSKQLRDGRRVGVDATQDEADTSFARQVVDHTRAHVTSGIYKSSNRGPVLQHLVDHMLSTGAAPDIDTLEAVDGKALPAAVYGPDVTPVTNHFGNFLTRSFEELVGKPMNALVRTPHFKHAYAEALEDTRPFAYKVKGIAIGSDDTGKEDAEKLASDLATQRAVNSMIPYIHNPELRTQFEDYHRNLFPFLFAQRQFLQRWGRTFADSPSAIRELQLTMNGLRTSGIVHRDQNGNDYFYYPGSQYVTEMLTSTLNQLGVHATVPFMEPFTGQVKYLMPGLANPVTPSVGPFAAIGMKEGEKLFPEMAGFNNAVLGQGSTESPVQQFLPAVVNRLYDALGPAGSGSQLMTTAAQFAKYLDATGHGLPNNPTPLQTQQYAARLTNGARSLLVARAMLGFVLPATPDADLDPDNLDSRYKELLSQLPYEQATTQFIKEHPDAVAYTVGSTEGSTEGGLPSTQEDLDWTNHNVAFTENYPAAAPWFAPRSPGTFSLTEFQEQVDTGERQSLPFSSPSTSPGSPSVLTDIINARASGAYYQTVDNYEAAYSAAGSSQARSQLTNQYDQWKADFFKRNPVFQEYIASEAGHVSRVTTINEVAKALKDPGLPQSGASENLKVAMETWNQFQSEYQDVTGSGSSEYDQRQTIKNNMIDWLNSSAKQAPDVSDFLLTILRPEVDETGS